MTLFEQTVRSANQELEARTKDHLSLAVAVLLEQRDQALSQVSSLSQNADEEQARSAAEHDRFVGYLMEEQDRKVEALQSQLKATREALERQKALALAHSVIGNAGFAAPQYDAGISAALGPSPSTAPPSAAAANAVASSSNQEQAHREQSHREQLQDLRRLLEMAYAELDEVKSVVPRLEEERDAALRAADDLRVELYGEVERARDEAILLQGQLDDAQRQLEDARDLAREEAHSWSERVGESERELDERRAEVERLRERMDSLTQEVQFSRPPPPTTSVELTKARDEVQQVRRELIDAKRQLSRMTRDYAVLKTQRAGSPRQAVRANPVLAAPVVPLPQVITPQKPRERAITPVGLGFAPEASSDSQPASATARPDTLETAPELDTTR